MATISVFTAEAMDIIEVGKGACYDFSKSSSAKLVMANWLHVWIFLGPLKSPNPSPGIGLKHAVSRLHHGTVWNDPSHPKSSGRSLLL